MVYLLFAEFNLKSRNFPGMNFQDEMKHTKSFCSIYHGFEHNLRLASKLHAQVPTDLFTVYCITLVLCTYSVELDFRVIMSYDMDKI
jgi:hypothetical protein